MGKRSKDAQRVSGKQYFEHDIELDGAVVIGDGTDGTSELNLVTTLAASSGSATGVTSGSHAATAFSISNFTLEFLLRVLLYFVIGLIRSKIFAS